MRAARLEYQPFCENQPALLSEKDGGHFDNQLDG